MCTIEPHKQYVNSTSGVEINPRRQNMRAAYNLDRIMKRFVKSYM